MVKDVWGRRVRRVVRLVGVENSTDSTVDLEAVIETDGGKANKAGASDEA